MASSTSSFMFGTIVGLFTSFIAKVKDMLRTFRSLFIQRDIVKFNPHILMHYFVKHGDIILLNRFMDRFYYIFSRNPDKCYMSTPTLHNYKGLALVKPSGLNLFKNLGNLIYLKQHRDENCFSVYYPRGSKVLDKLFNLCCQKRYDDHIRVYYPYQYSIEMISDSEKTFSKSASENVATARSTEEASDSFPLFLHSLPLENRIGITVVKANYNVYSLDDKVTTPVKFLERWYPLFYCSNEFKELVRIALVWKLCNIKESIRQKTSVLLYGPPGTGKSMMISMLGRVVNVPIYVFDVLTLNQHTVVTKMNELTKHNCIILFEDIDVYFDYWNNNKTIVNTSLFSKDIIKPSTFLNLIDGVDKQSSCMIIFTTNYPERIDKRMIDVDKDGNIIVTRPGRIDKVIKVDYATEEGIEHICSNFMNHYSDLISRTGLNVQLSKDELRQRINKTMSDMNGSITYSHVINCCMQYLTYVLEQHCADPMKLLDRTDINIGY